MSLSARQAVGRLHMHVRMHAHMTMGTAADESECQAGGRSVCQPVSAWRGREELEVSRSVSQLTYLGARQVSQLTYLGKSVS